MPGLLLLAVGLFGGCVNVYQPISGLHRPVVVDTGVANFQDLRIAVYCPPGDLVNREQARSLCTKVGTLFENQGARVVTSTSRRGLKGRYSRLNLSSSRDSTDQEHPPVDLTLELRSRQVHEHRHPFLTVLCVLTYTIVPAVHDSTFAQDVIIRDGNGFLLVSDTLQGQIVRYTGLGIWMGNKVLDLVWREEQDRLTGDAAKRDLSADLYSQLSQLVLNARLRSQVLQEASPTVGVE